MIANQLGATGTGSSDPPRIRNRSKPGQPSLDPVSEGGWAALDPRIQGGPVNPGSVAPPPAPCPRTAQTWPGSSPKPGPCNQLATQAHPCPTAARIMQKKHQNSRIDDFLKNQFNAPQGPGVDPSGSKRFQAAAPRIQAADPSWPATDPRWGCTPIRSSKGRSKISLDPAQAAHRFAAMLRV